MSLSTTKLRKKAYNIKYRKDHYDAIRKKQKERYFEKRPQILEYFRKKYQENKNNPDFKIRKREWTRKSYLKHRDRKLAQAKERGIKLRKELLLAVGGIFCVRCGFSDWRALQVDHINGGGCKELVRDKELRKITRSPLTYKKHILKNKNNYQVLCANCNWIKKYENKENRKVV